MHAHCASEPRPRVRSQQRCGRALSAGPTAHGLNASRLQGVVEPGRMLAQIGRTALWHWAAHVILACWLEINLNSLSILYSIQIQIRYLKIHLSV
jgi:hypothetical protein